ncbi:MAG: Ig-like domain-containing protein [Oscillospiraceae bacterium]|nr:Ig-like domain-containing protein [Oscillospiraceae bacterium]
MNKKAFRSLFVLMLALALCLSITACGGKKETEQTPDASAPPQPVTSSDSTAIVPELTTSVPAPATPETTATPSPPVSVSLRYEGQEVTTLGFMTSTVFQLQAVTSNGTSGGTWTSSDASSASVDENGVVTCWKAGKPTITYTIGDASASCALTITEPTVGIFFAGVAKTDIVLSSVWGYEIQFYSVVSPEGSPVTWSSDDSSVASVSDNGLVIAHKMGTTNINCKCGTAKATCIVRVLDNPPTYLTATPDPADNTPRIVITYLGVPNTDLTMTVGDTLNMSYLLYNIDPGAKVTWTISDPSYASVNENGFLTALKSTFGPIPGRNYTILTATCGNYSCEAMVFIKAKQ